ncbi:MAG TPA: shikimate dehydrogenase [Solirubrobacteraceae bacterium]|nr:shikimate dehydrogenase [Solirubrobacteraceae bacterium]
MPRLGVLGWPVAHSRSPAIHNAAFAAVGMEDWRYQRLAVPPELFAETTRALEGSGFHGANVTIPHKQAALTLADEATVTARAIGAANTLTFSADGSIAAANTDAPGLIAALGESPRGQRFLILGAGGSARAAAWALRDAGAAEVSVWNRTPERAVALAGELGVRALTAIEPADVLVNCTSVGLEQTGAGEGSPGVGAAAAPRGGADVEAASEQAPVERSATEANALNQLGMTFDQLGEYPYVVDLVYRPGTTPLLAAARAHGARTLDGLEILVAQGALSFELWTGRVAPREAMLRAARAEDPAG